MKRRVFNRTLGAAAGSVMLSRLNLDRALGQVGRLEAREAIERLRGEPAAEAEIRSERGGPRLFLNGKEIYPFMGSSTHLYPTIGNFEAAGILLIHPILGMQSGWLGPNRYDWSVIDTFLGRLLALYPGAYFLPRLQLNSPTWWKDAHPGELIVYGLPTPAEDYDVANRRNIEPSEGGHRFSENRELREASFASQVWRRDTAQMLKTFLRHIDESPLASRVIGYHPTTGRTAEWNYYGEDYLPDYSEPMRAAAGVLPDAAARMNSSLGLLRDPAKEADVITFYRAYHRAIGETVVSIVRAVKQGTGRKIICGVFYGYVSEQPRIQEGGYQAAELVLASPDIDYIASPYAYQPGNSVDDRGIRVTMVDGAGNRLGHARGVGGDGAYRIPAESLRRRGKMFIAELDPSTYRDAAAYSVVGGHGGQGSDTMEGSLRILRRDLGGVFASGIGGWLLDFGAMNKAPEGWYSGEPVIREIRALVELGRRRPELDISPVADICTVADLESFHVTAHWTYGKPWTNYGIKSTDFFNHWFLNTQGRALHRIGAPMDELYMFDLTAADARRYRFIAVLNGFRMDADEAARIRSLLRDSGTTVLWFYAPGLVTPDSISLPQMESLTGFRFRMLETPGTMMVNSGIHDRVAGFPARFGVDELHGPRFRVEGTGYEPLGEWSDGEGVAFARKSYEGYTSVYVGTAPVPAGILRKLAGGAGARIWSTAPDIVRASRDAAMIVATESGTRTLTLPSPMVPVDGGSRSAVHTLEMKYGDVRLFTA